MYVEQSIDATAHLDTLAALAVTVPMRGAASYISAPEETPPALTAQIVELLHVTPIRVAVVTLQPMQQIPLHTDPPIVGDRFHLPVLVNEGCWSYGAGIWQQLSVGRVYWMDPTLPHGAVNWGATPRLHLLV